MSSTLLIFHVLANYIRQSTTGIFVLFSKQFLIYFTLIIVWLSFEFIHFHWDFSWPWLTLGNTLAFFPSIAQWYEYTGVLGGSLWILLLTVFIFDKVVINPGSFLNKKTIRTAMALLLIPIAISYTVLLVYTEKGVSVEVVIVQPNIDPYEEKFPAGKRFIPYDKQLDIFFQLAEEKITPDTRYVVLPETAYPIKWELKNLEKLKNMDKFYDFRNRHKDLSLIVGLETFRRYPSIKGTSFTTRYTKGTGYFDYYNSAVQLNNLNEIPISHKSKHLHWAESIPLRRILNFIEPLTIYLGGFGSHGIQKNRVIFEDKYSNKIATVICYESVYGAHVSDFVQKGAQALFIITNDGWWKDSPAYKQHLAYDRLRAIENRKSIARSSNNGISCIINQKGNLEIKSTFSKRESIRGNLKLNSGKTLYSICGDWIGKIVCVFTGAFIFYILIIQFQYNKNKN